MGVKETVEPADPAAAGADGEVDYKKDAQFGAAMTKDHAAVSDFAKTKTVKQQVARAAAARCDALSVRRRAARVVADLPRAQRLSRHTARASGHDCRRRDRLGRTTRPAPRALPSFVSHTHTHTHTRTRTCQKTTQLTQYLVEAG